MKKRTIAGMASVFLLAACEPVKVTGGGIMTSQDGVGKAVYTFNGNSCDLENIKGHVNLHDKTATNFQELGGLKLQGTVDSVYFCSTESAVDAPICQCPVGSNEINFSYRSINPKVPGNGTGISCMADTGEGGGNTHLNGRGMIRIDSGPFSGYQNESDLTGNVQVHNCD